MRIPATRVDDRVTDHSVRGADIKRALLPEATSDDLKLAMSRSAYATALRIAQENGRACLYLMDEIDLRIHPDGTVTRDSRPGVEAR